MALDASAVVMNEGSLNHTPGRSFRISSAEIPPSTIGISTASPVRLSVTVMESVTDPPRGESRRLELRASYPCPGQNDRCARLHLR